MKCFFRFFLFQVLKFILWLRYKVEVIDPQGVLSQDPEEGVLFLPNHPAEVDPLILTRLLWKKYRIQPVVTEKFYEQPLLRPFMDIVGVIPLPVLNTLSSWKKQKILQAKQAILRTLRAGQSILLYPSGKLREGGIEKLGGASLLADLLVEEPSIKIVLIRTTGLRGSLFSKEEGESPDFVDVGRKTLKALLKSGIFFLPKRIVKVEFEKLPLYCFSQLLKVDINSTLEQWYNQEGEEPLQKVPYHRIKQFDQTPFCATIPGGAPLKKDKTKEGSTLNPEEKQAILSHLSKMTGTPLASINEETHLSHDLGLDSLEIATLCVYLEERFERIQAEPNELKRVEDLFFIAEGKNKQGPHPISNNKKKWPKEPKNRPFLEIPEGETIEEVFLASCARMKGYMACGEGNHRYLSYQKLRKRVILLSLFLEKKEKEGKEIGSYVGVLLPASIAAYVSILSLLLLGKIPVMLNWTTGEKALESVLEKCPLSLILSADKFLNRLENIDFSLIELLLFPLEQVRKELDWKTLLRAWFLSVSSDRNLLTYFKRERKKENTAVVLFTSGSEGIPKAVPLSHKNLLCNQKAALSCIEFYPSDIFYGILPPFHSFGFSLAGLFPLLSGLKVYYAPDPTDVYGLLRDIRDEKLTLLCSAPSFLQPLFKQGAKEKGSKALSTLRLVATGAEKAAPALFAQAKEQGIVLLEGYGITECSPVVTLERGEKKEGEEGVGMPLPGVSLCIIDLETTAPLSNGKEGEICIAGDNVFSGYISEKKVPFLFREGIQWYRSGDLGFINAKGALVLTGRLKRFVKIGGEMINLNALEIAISALYQDKKELKLALIAKGEGSGELQVILFATEPLLKEEINRSLREEGRGRLAKIGKVEYLPELPLTGTGKIDYLRLETLL